MIAPKNTQRKNLKFAWLSAVVFGVTLSAAAQPITVDAKSLPQLPPLTARTVNPDLVRGVCVQAVQREETATKRIEVLNASVVHTKDERSAACVVSAKVMEGVRAYGPIQITEVRYSGKVNLETGKVDLARIDEEAGKQVALNALAAMFIDLKPTSMAQDKMTYKALIAGKKCVIEVANDTSPDPKRWLVTKLDCKR